MLLTGAAATRSQVTIERGKTLHIKTLAMAADLTANGEREVFFELNGQLRSVFIRDNEATKVGSTEPRSAREQPGRQRGASACECDES